MSKLTHEPRGRFASNFDEKTRQNPGNIISEAKQFEVQWVAFKEESLYFQTMLDSQASDF